MNLGKWPASLMTCTVANKITDKHIARLRRDTQIPDLSIFLRRNRADILTSPCRFHFLDPKRLRYCWHCCNTAFWTTIMRYMFYFIAISLILQLFCNNFSGRNSEESHEWRGIWWEMSVGKQSDKPVISAQSLKALPPHTAKHSHCHVQVKAFPVGQSADAQNSQDDERLPHGILLPNLENHSNVRLLFDFFFLVFMRGRFREPFSLTETQSDVRTLCYEVGGGVRQYQTW